MTDTTLTFRIKRITSSPTEFELMNEDPMGVHLARPPIKITKNLLCNSRAFFTYNYKLYGHLG